MVYKLNTFMTSGVCGYWIVNIANHRIAIYGFKDCQADKMEVYKKGEAAVSACFDGLGADAESVFAGLL